MNYLWNLLLVNVNFVFFCCTAQFSLNDTHFMLTVHWAGEGSDVVVCLTRNPPQSSDTSSSVFVSTDYGRTFVNKDHLFRLPNDRPVSISRFFNHPKFNSHVRTAAFHWLSIDQSPAGDSARVECHLRVVLLFYWQWSPSLWTQFPYVLLLSIGHEPIRNRITRPTQSQRSFFSFSPFFLTFSSPNLKRMRFSTRVFWFNGLCLLWTSTSSALKVDVFSFFFIILLTGGREQYVFTDLANKYIFTTVDYGATVQSYPLLFTPDEIIFDEREPLSLLVNHKQQQQRDRALPSFQLQFDPVSSTSSFTFLLLEPKSIRFGFSW